MRSGYIDLGSGRTWEFAESGFYWSSTSSNVSSEYTSVYNLYIGNSGVTTVGLTDRRYGRPLRYLVIGGGSCTNGSLDRVKGKCL